MIETITIQVNIELNQWILLELVLMAWVLVLPKESLA